MHIYCLLTKNYKKMYNDFFIKSLKKINFDTENCLHTKYINEDGCHYDDKKEFANYMLEKIKLIIQTIENNIDKERFIYSDVDIAFYKPFEDYINKFDEELLFQQSVPGLKLCAGFMVIKPNISNLNFFKDVIKVMNSDKNDIHDQTAIRKMIYSKNNTKKYKYLPYDKFITGGSIVDTTDPNNEKKWILKNKDIYMHHGNYSTGDDIKYNQMKFVWEQINK